MIQGSTIHNYAIGRFNSDGKTIGQWLHLPKRPTGFSPNPMRPPSQRADGTVVNSFYWNFEFEFALFLPQEMARLAFDYDPLRQKILLNYCVPEPFPDAYHGLDYDESGNFRWVKAPAIWGEPPEFVPRSRLYTAIKLKFTKVEMSPRFV